MHTKSKGPLKRHHTQTYQLGSPLLKGNKERKQNIGISGALGGDLVPYQQNAAILIKKTGGHQHK